MTRQTKTHRQRAEEAVGVAERRVERITQALTHQRSLVDLYQADLDEAEQRLAYAKADPALNTTQQTTTKEKA